MSFQSIVEDAIESVDAFGPVEEVFASLGWAPRRLLDRHGRKLLSLGLGETPQILVTLGLAQSEVSDAVSLAYSHESPLALRWGSESLSIHEARSWKNLPGDAPLALSVASQQSEVASLLYSLGRDRFENLERSRSQRIALLPDHLADSFALFRISAREKMEWDRGDANDPFVAFHQLLFIRMHEDRHPDGVPLTASAAAADGELQSLLAWYSSRFDSELFERSADVESLPQQELRRLIDATVEPWAKLTLDFSVAEDDLAGRLYESYLSRSVQLSDELQLFPQAVFVNRQKQAGAYYTPAPLANRLTADTLGRWLELRSPAKPQDVRIVDPACGSGAFLAAAYRLLEQYFEDRRGRRLNRRERIQILKSLVGVDIDREALMLARLRLIEIADLGEAQLPDLTENLIEGDALSGSLPVLEPGAFDVVLANPPFESPGAGSGRSNLAQLASRYPSLSGTGRNLAYAFADLAMSLLRQGGMAGLVLPRSVLDGGSGHALRQNIGPWRLDSVLDLGSNVLFGSASAYVAGVVVHAGQHRGRSVNLAHVDDSPSIGRDRVFEELSNPESIGSFSVAVSATSVAASGVWTPFWHRWAADLVHRLSVQTAPLVESAELKIVIGTQLGDQSKFVMDEGVVESSKSVTTNGIRIPKPFAPIFLRGRNIKPFQVIGSPPRAVVPLLGENAQVDKLVEKLGGVPDSFRPGDLPLLRSPKVLIRNLGVEVAAVADVAGGLMPAQGGNGATSIVPTVDSLSELRYIEGLLNSSLFQWLLRGLGHPKRGGFQLMKHHLEALPWPMLDSAERSQIAEAASAVTDALHSEGSVVRAARYWSARVDLDSAVFAAVGADERLREIVDQEVWREP